MSREVQTSEYLQWIHEATGQWGTWQPGRQVALGDYGYFNETMEFVRIGSVQSLLGITPHADRQNIGSHLYSHGHFHSVKPEVAVSVPGTGSASVAFELKRGSGSLLQINGGAQELMTNEFAVLDAVKQAIADRTWCLGWVLIGERIRVEGGFTATFKGRGSKLTASLKTGRSIPGSSMTAVGSFGLDYISSTQHVHHWLFPTGSTPVFGRLWRLNPRLAHEIAGAYRWKGRKRVLVSVPLRNFYCDGPDSYDGRKWKEMMGLQREQLFETGFPVSTS